MTEAYDADATTVELEDGRNCRAEVDDAPLARAAIADSPVQ